MAEKEDGLDRIIMTILGATIGVVLLCTCAIPVITGEAGIGALVNIEGGDTYKALIGVVVIMLIIGLIIPIVRGYNKSRR